MSSSFAKIKQKTLQRQLAEKIEEYEAVTSQFGSVMDSLSHLRLERQAKQLAKEIDKIEAELASLDVSPGGSVLAAPAIRNVWVIILVLLSIVGLVWLSWFLFAPDCRPPLIQFHVSSQGQTGVTIIPDSQYSVSPGEPLMVRAIVNDEEQSMRGRYSCEWAYAGDGRIIAVADCSLQLKAGQDLINDIVTLTVSQQGCRTIKVETFFLASP
jgi:hypothetical protein